MSQDEFEIYDATNYNQYPVVWCEELRKFAYLIRIGAYFSTIVYFEDGLEYEEQIENNEYQYWEERTVYYETE